MKLAWDIFALAVVLFLSSVFCRLACAQGLDTSALLKPTPDSWPIYHGDYSGQRHSHLSQITPANVRDLTLAWAFETGQTAQIKSSPIVANGILYVSIPDHVWAVDARTGSQVWHYTYPPNEGLHIGHRGVAVYKDSVYLTTPDDHVLVGVSGDFDNIPGMLKSLSADTGETQWTFYSTPAPGTQGFASGGATGGNMWITGTYDPELNLVFVGTGNPTPVLAAQTRPGDNPWTCSIVALNPDTGKLVWGFQATPHDTHDWDAVEIP